MAEGTNPFKEVIEDLFDEETAGISTRRQLAARLALLKGTTLEGERKSVRTHIRTGRAEEESLVWYAKAFKVDRSVFPAAATRESQTALLRERIERLAFEFDAIDSAIGRSQATDADALSQTVFDRLESLEARYERLRDLVRDGFELLDLRVELEAEEGSPQVRRAPRRKRVG